jgi:streptomycin 6-kinase
MDIDMALFDPWLARWDLTPDGEPISGTWAELLPVKRGDQPAMLKAAMTREEQHGLDLLAWYRGDGAVKILERGDKAILMERAMGERSLKAMARAGDDEAALTVLCAASSGLNRSASGILARCWTEAQDLLATARESRPLHGDLWHDNVRDDRARGWLAIDPMGFVGERTYDYAVMVTNPDFPAVAADPERIRRRAAFVARTADLHLVRLMRCIMVDASLYALWSISRGDEPRALAVAEIAASMVDAG